jgi:small nuclear ribonucleoprotein (snRNP)-like protein
MPPVSALHPVTGTLKGYDQLLNLVLDDVEEEVTGTLLVSPSLPLMLKQLTPPREPRQCR